ncbi:MAG: hypothetical protein GY838_11980 [bacterium]|nr:hypothetical protein [bacterium]
MPTPEIRSNLLLLALAALIILVGAAPGVRAQGMGDLGSELVNVYIERTDELIGWAKELVEETDSGTARRVLEQAYNLNRRAGRTNGTGQFRSAKDLAQRARAAVWHAVKLGREAMSLQERLRVRTERFRELHRQLVDRARNGGNEEALGLLQRSERQAGRAREQHLQGDVRMAWQMLERAEELTLRAARLLAESTDPERLEAELDRVAELIDQARGQLDTGSANQARRRLNEAEEALEKAHRHLDQGEPGRALQMATLARRLARGAFGTSVAAPSPEALERQLERFDARVDRLDEALRETDNERARHLFGEANEHRRRASAAGDQGDVDAGLRQIRAAHDLLNQIKRMLR